MKENNSLKGNGAVGWLRRRKVELIALAVAALLIVVDQLTKAWVVKSLPFGEPVAIIKGVLNFTYIHNDGAVFGSLSGKPEIFNTVTVAVVIAALFCMLIGKFKNNWLKWTTALIISGGIGNLIDRFRLGYVIDFIDVKCFGELWKWIFNIADCCVVIGCIMLIIYFAFDIVADFKKQKAEKAAVASEQAEEGAEEQSDGNA